MKKTGALVLATFYLMLTTGMFVCMLYCSGNMLFISGGHSHFHAHEKATETVSTHSAKAGHADEKGCKCCDQHGEYVIKENIKTAGADLDLSAQNALLTCVLPAFLIPSVSRTLIYAKKWPENTGPPSVLKEPIYISNRVLLI